MASTLLPRTLTTATQRFASTSSAASTGKHKILVIGAGSAGLSVANQLYNSFKADGLELGAGDVAIVDASTQHDFQPGWTLVGTGLKPKSDMRRPLSELIPSHISHIPSNVKSFSPNANSITLESGESLSYDFLVVAAGIQTNWNKIKGLEAALENPLESKVSSIYSYATCDKTWDLIRDYNGTSPIFTQPFGPIKCAGAPQKVMYMANSTWNSRPSESRPKQTSQFITGMPSMFSVPYYSNKLNELRKERGMDAMFNTNLVEVKAADKTAIFESLAGENKGQKIEKQFDLLHVTPPMSPLDFIKASPLADAAGWVDVSQSTLQHTKFSNIFSLGDCSSLPTSKTAAAITAQTPVLVENLRSVAKNGKVGNASYDGYTSCPLFTGHGELMLAEFKYGFERSESFGALVDQGTPRRAFYHLAKDVFPYAYFNHMVKGNWYGPKGLFPPQYAPAVVPS